MLRPLLTPGRLLTLVLLLAAALRFYGIEWDQRAGQHPDERHVLMSVGTLEWPTSIGQYLDEQASPLNPRNRNAHFWAYGTLPTTLLRAVVEVGGVKKPEDTLL